MVTHPLSPAASPYSGNSSSNPNTLQFLSNVLSQRGPSSLPYSEDVKWLIRQHLLSLTDAFPSLQPKTASFIHNDGQSVNLLQVDGTIPMVFQGVTYNIPVVIWLMETYPRHAPRVYVNPTRDMIIKRPHQHVDPSGLVSIPYLRNWVYPSSNLVDLGRNLSHFFALDPPLYSQRRTNPNPNPNPNPSNHGLMSSSSDGSGFSMNPIHNPSNVGLMSSSSMGSEFSGSGVNPPRIFPPSPYVGSGRIMPQRPGTGTDDPNEVFKRNAINKLVEMVHGDIVGLQKTREAEMDGLFNVQSVLRQREEQLNRGLKEMQDEKEALEQQLQMVLMNADLLEGWLRENEDKMCKLGNVDVDDAFEPCDSLSKQMIEASAMDLAIEDVIYSLDKAVQEGALPFDQYLKNIRLLSREQFFHRATAAKVRGAQIQAHVSNMAGRTSQYGT